MIDPKHIGRQLPPVVFEVEKGRLRFFAKATGETRPEYLDETAARVAGHSSLPAPPTFVFSAELDAGSMFSLLEELQVPLTQILHGEQEFTYHAPIHAGDLLTVQSSIADIYAKKGGELEFIVKDSTVSNQHGGKVVSTRSVIVVRHPRKKTT
ncbi:MaoC family dehydratase N-terminal domain-containing protein [Aquabacterium sp. CECT 9606]|uniref:MaoC family dehydratase N-terminal domain-containing protein n=1 Tax=Aquabacterium sp. CECT 9606 TaxID=2845822 RepID=UPI001E448CBD|nr:MaoC family dehydratase N-terminal domain-containing protein [Aquabacterium sp. CECT 9606]CAH0353249.1 hypothetical protein AQB9606_03136 [Aquabacterium sp. CECT 9606]